MDTKAILDKIDTVLTKVENACIMFFFIAMAVMVLLQVFYRFILAAPSPWSEVFARYALIYLVMFGSSLALSKEDHLSINVVDVIIKNTKIQRYLNIFVAFSVLVACFILIRSAYHYIGAELHLYSRCSGSGIRMIYFYSSMLIGFFLMVIHAIIVLIKTCMLSKSEV